MEHDFKYWYDHIEMYENHAKIVWNDGSKLIISPKEAIDLAKMHDLEVVQK